MLSIRVALVLVIRVGLEISGNRLQLNNKLMNSVVGVECALHILINLY